MKTRNMITMLGLGYLALGLSATANHLEMDRFQNAEILNDTNKVTIEIEGINPDSGLIKAVSEMVAKSTAEATKLSAEIAAINAKVEAGELSAEEAEAQIAAKEAEFEARMEALSSSMEEWGEEFGERMERWGEEFGKKWEDREIELEEALSSADEETSIRLNFSTDDEEPARSGKTKFSFFEMSLGTNSFLDAGMPSGNLGTAAIGDDLLNWESVNFRFSFGNKYKIGGASSPLLLQLGLGLETNTYSFKGEDVLVKGVDGAGNYVTAFAPEMFVTDMRYNSWNTTYLELPAMLHLDLSPRGKVDKSLNVGFGGYAGVRLDSYTEVRGRDIEGDRITNRSQNNLNTNLFRYGLQGQVGYKSFKVTGRLDAAPIFQKDAYSEDAYVGSIGIGFCF